MLKNMHYDNPYKSDCNYLFISQVILRIWLYTKIMLTKQENLTKVQYLLPQNMDSQ